MPLELKHNPERNLIFAGLGLQLGLIRKDQVIRAFTDLLFDKARPLGEILVAQNGLTEEQRKIIDAAVEAHIQQEGDEAKALASLNNVKDLGSDLDHLADEDIYRTVDIALALHKELGTDRLGTRLPELGKEGPASLPFPALKTAEKDRFERMGFLDSGNLGEVYFAMDSELNRMVVAKYIKANAAQDRLNQALFHLEGEVTGSLEHPGIVPVYGLGRDSQGRIYYAMRYIRGRKLSQVIAEYQGIPPSDPGAKQEALIGLLQNFQAACLAVEYAHIKGVLHCDLKPDNIMIGDYGEVFVVDWGLVVVHGQKKEDQPYDPLRTLGEGDIPVFRPSESASSGLHINQGGSRCGVGGTPAYMAPEQVQATTKNDVSLLGPAADIYALGGTLYQLLTGNAPHLPKKEFKEGQTGFYNRILAGQFSTPRELKPAIPRGLEAIVLKAMRLQPEDRYKSARELAEDVKRFVADEPVWAYPEPAFERARRWVRKNRALVGAAMVGLILMTFVATGFGWITSSYNERLTISEGQARESEYQAQEEKKKAKANEQLAVANEARALEGEKLARVRESLAIDAVRKYSEAVKSNPDLKNRPELEPLRKELLREPIEFFKKLNKQMQAEKSTTPESLQALALGLFDLGKLTREIGDQEDAIKSFLEAEQIFSLLVKKIPTVTEYQANLAASHNNLGNLYRGTGRKKEAEVSYEKALALQETLIQKNPTVTQYQADLAISHNNLGILYRDTGRNKEAEASYQKALALRETLVLKNPTVTEYQADLAFSHYNFGNLYSGTGRSKEAEVSWQKALALRESLFLKNPTVTEYQANLAASHLSLAILYSGTGRIKEAEVSWQKALALRETLVLNNPTVTQYQADLAFSHFSLGFLYRDTGRGKEAEVSYEKALALRESLVQKNPTVPEYLADLAGSHYSLGILYRGTGRSKEAEASWQKALALRETLVLNNPTVTEYQADLANSHNNLGVLYTGTGRSKEAEVSWQKAIALRETLVLKNPTVTEYQADLVHCYLNLGLLCIGTGRKKEAEVSYEKAIALLETLVLKNPTVTEYQAALASSHLNVGILYSATGRGKEAEASYQKALALQETLVQKNPTVPEYRFDLATTRNRLAWSICFSAKRLPEEYQKALSLAGAASLSQPTNGGFLNTLGVAQFRVKDYVAAITTLEKSNAINRTEAKGREEPGDLAFLAMAQFQLGKVKEAEGYFKKLQEAMKNPSLGGDKDNKAILEEAEQLFKSAKK